MSSVVISGDTSGAVTLAVPSVAGTNTITVPASTGTMALTSQLPVAGPAFSAYNSSVTSLTPVTWTKVAFQTKEFDTNNNFDSTTNYRFTPTVAGYYQIDTKVGMNNTQNGLIVAIYKNGSNFKTGTFCYGASVDNCRASVAALISMNGSTDYLEVYAINLPGSTAYNTLNTAAETYFQGFLARTA